MSYRITIQHSLNVVKVQFLYEKWLLIRGAINVNQYPDPNLTNVSLTKLQPHTELYKSNLSLLLRQSLNSIIKFMQ